MSRQKELMVDEIKSYIEGKDVIVTGFNQLASQPMVDLRDNLRKVNARYFVVKNRLFRKVIGDLGLPEPKKWTGHTGVIASDDVVGLAKCIAGFKKDHQDNLELRFGYLGEKLLTEEEIINISKLPPREVLIAKLLGVLNGPISNFAGVLRAQLSKIVYVLKAISDSKES